MHPHPSASPIQTQHRHTSNMRRGTLAAGKATMPSGKMGIVIVLDDPDELSPNRGMQHGELQYELEMVLASVRTLC